MPVSINARVFLETASALGVILGLIFVGLELRHSNNLAQAEALASLNGLTASLVMSKHDLPVSDDFWVRYRNGDLNDAGDVSPTDLDVLDSYLTATINLFESAWKYRDTGILGEAETQGYLISACATFTRNGLSKSYWRRAHTFTPGFMADVEAVCVELRDDS
jgi:hypothetical protein